MKIDLDVLSGRVNLLRDATKVLRSLDIPVPHDIELLDEDIRALPAPAKDDPA